MGGDPRNTGLSLGRREFADAFASMSWGWGREHQQPVRFHILFPPCPMKEDGERGKLAGEDRGAVSCRLRQGTTKKDEDVVDSDAHKVDGGGRHAESNGGPRKKLRITREQLTLLEHSFRQQGTLTATQKHELAEKLKLLPRQVEVWFQNKRARTKLKQTEVDCQLLKKCCKSLSDENKRLKEELRELRSIKQGSPTAKLTMCPTCEWAAASGGSTTRAFFDDDAARGNV